MRMLENIKLKYYRCNGGRLVHLLTCITILISPLYIYGESAGSAYERLRQSYGLSGDREKSDTARGVLERQQSRHVSRADQERARAAGLTGEERDKALKRAQLFEERSAEVNRRILDGQVNMSRKNEMDGRITSLMSASEQNKVPQLHPDMHEADYEEYLKRFYVVDDDIIIEKMLTPRPVGRYGHMLSPYYPDKETSRRARFMIDRVKETIAEDRQFGRLSTDYDDPANRHLAKYPPLMSFMDSLGRFERMDRFGRLYHVNELERYLRHGVIPARYQHVIEYGITPETYVSDAAAQILWRRSQLDKEAADEVVTSAIELGEEDYDTGSTELLNRRTEHHETESSAEHRVDHRAGRTDRISERARERIAAARDKELTGGSDIRTLRADTEGRRNEIRRNITAERRRFEKDVPDRDLSDEAKQRMERYINRAESSNIRHGDRNITVRQAKQEAGVK